MKNVKVEMEQTPLSLLGKGLFYASTEQNSIKSNLRYSQRGKRNLDLELRGGVVLENETV